MGRLPMTEGSPRTFSPIVRRLPMGMAQELRELCKAGRGHPVLHGAEGRQCPVVWVGVPGVIAGLCLRQWAPLPIRRSPQGIPFHEEAAGLPDERPQRPCGERGDLLLLLSTQMLGPAE